MAERVLILHGLWMRRPAMWLLARRLRASGFSVRCFPYATLWAQPESSFRRLAQWMRECGDGPVHLVGHSLGGVTALAMLAAHSRDDVCLPAGRVVCIGSPIAGSQAAASLRDRGLTALVGRSASLLQRGVSVPSDREVGMIAGTRNVGLGRWLTRIRGPHDGSVAVAETRQPGLVDHLCLDASHSGLLFSAEAAAQVASFLHSGRFKRV